MKSIPIRVAAALMGKGQQFVREGLKRKTLPIGTAMRLNPDDEKSRINYYISPKLFAEYTGVTEADLIKELENQGVR